MALKLLRYFTWFLFFFIPFNLVIWAWFKAEDEAAVGDLAHKVHYYRQHCAQFNLLFLGDSRTYCDFDPLAVDNILGTSSVNLAEFAHWFPTQYPNFQDIASVIPEKTLVVWSIGHLNFSPCDETGEVNLRYPIGLSNLPRYLSWGYSWESIAKNAQHSLQDTATPLFAWLPVNRYRDALRRELRSLGRGPGTTSTQPALTNNLSFDALQRQFSQEPSVARVEPVLDRNTITSAAIYKVRGNYVRVELEPDYFRAKQRELGPAYFENTSDRKIQEECYWNTFVALLDLFAYYGVRLVVNEMEEAPFRYENPIAREYYRSFMRDVESYVIGRGIPYIRVDWDRFDNADYFDFDHLNSRGIERFTPLFAEKVRPYLIGK